MKYYKYSYKFMDNKKVHIVREIIKDKEDIYVDFDNLEPRFDHVKMEKIILNILWETYFIDKDNHKKKDIDVHSYRDESFWVTDVSIGYPILELHTEKLDRAACLLLPYAEEFYLNNPTKTEETL